MWYENIRSNDLTAQEEETKKMMSSASCTAAPDANCTSAQWGVAEALTEAQVKEILYRRFVSSVSKLLNLNPMAVASIIKANAKADPSQFVKISCYNYY